MTHFLDRTAEYLVKTYGSELSDIAVVLPNRRAGLFLRRFMAVHAGKACWSPLVFSVEDFITGISGLHEAESLALLFELYAVHKEVEGEQAQPFEEFIHWAPQLLSDFNEIDRYLVDPQQLFSYLDEARVLSLWNLENQPLTDFETKYLRFYHSLGTYYKLLSQRMLASRRAWQGLLFRHAAETIPEAVYSLPWKQVVFAGFNALTKAEEVIIGELRLHKKATLLWDADEYYLNNDVQEAGSFLREWIRKWPANDLQWVGDDFAGMPKDIRIIGAPDPVGQVKFCGNLLQGLALQGKANESTAVVLLDPALLNPLLNSMPEEVKELNITAGLPLKQTPLADLFELVFRLHLNTKQFSYLKSSKTKKFYYKDVLRVLRHPMVQEMATSLAGDNRFAFEQVIERIRQGSRIFISHDELIAETTGLFGSGLSFLDSLFTGWETPQEALSAFRTVIESLRAGLMHDPQEARGLEDPEIKLELEYLFSFTKIFHQLSTILEETGAILTLQTFYQIFRQSMESTSLPFSGEPLRGLQVMGMLETRTLDFENVILLSCNEDLLPAGKITPSFIPFDIKRDFGLPTYRHKDAVYAYHFYRLLQRAKNVWILYTTEANELGGGDKSRFIRQIEQELPAGHPNIKIQSTLLAPPAVAGTVPPEIKVEKLGEVWTLLEKKAEEGFSATSLNAFRSCSLKFYLQEIAGIREAEEIAETIDAKILGLAIHEALAALYAPCKEKALTPEAFAGMQKLAEEAVMKGFAKKYRGSDINFGKNHLLVNVAKLIVKRFLRFEKSAAEELAREKKEMRLLWTEERVTGHVTVNAGDRKLNVNLKGFIDRVDRFGGTLRIIDYKSGTALNKNLEVQDWEELFSNPDLDMAFQLLMYSYLLKGRFRNGFEVSAGVIPLRKLNSGLMTAGVPESDGTEDLIGEGSLKRFEEVVVKILETAFDQAIPFSQTDNTEVCKKCPYVNLCRR